MNSGPLVSVIIPVYNTEKYVENAVLSVLNQSYKHIEVLIVIDGSPDNAETVCRGMAAENKNIKILKHEENRGSSAARNTGIAASGGEYIVFLDSDDILLENAISEMLAIIEKEETDAVYPQKYIRRYSNTDKQYKKNYFDIADCNCLTPLNFAAEVLIAKCSSWGSTARIYRASTIKDNEIEFTEGITAEDIVFNLDFLKKSTSISFCEFPTESILKRTNSVTTSYKDNFKSTILYIYDVSVEFLTETGFSQKEIVQKSCSLLCRSVTAYIVNIMSDRNPVKGFSAKTDIVKTLLKDETITKAYSSAVSTPYFHNRARRIFFKTMNRLIKRKMYTSACVIACLASKWRRK